MSPFSSKTYRYILISTVIIVVIMSLLYANHLVKIIKSDERQKVETWAKAMSLVVDVDAEDRSFDLIWNIIENNENIPVLVINETGELLASRNFSDETFATETTLLQKKIARLQSRHQPIVLDSGEMGNLYVYYDDSILLKKLTAFPYVLWSIIAIILIFGIWIYSAETHAEQNRVWVGLSKETAHQLGTPISSLMALTEILKDTSGNDEIVQEITKDVDRLNTIADRFSKVGSKPVLEAFDIASVMQHAIDYMKRRTSSRVQYQINAPEGLTANINVPLFEWVVENLCKNAVDAMSGEGSISVNIEAQKNGIVAIDITDTGKGIERKNFRNVFKPGFTTKKRGWGLGLSLAKRIIEEYHSGKIMVKNSEIGKGTTFRILLNGTEKQLS